MKQVLAIPDAKAGKVTFRIWFDSAGPMPEKVDLLARVLPEGGKTPAGQKKATVPPGQSPIDITVALKDAKAWTPEKPFLYTADIAAEGADHVRFTFGMRTIEVAGGHYRLNGERLWLRGSNLVSEWLWADSNNDFNKNIKTYIVDEARNMNLNCFRTHTLPPPTTWLDVCDRYGTMILAEFPVLYNFKDFKFTPAEYEVFHKHVLQDADGWVTKLWNHPSVVVWVISNETREHRHQWEMGPYRDHVRALDPTRPVLRCGEDTAETDDMHICGNLGRRGGVEPPDDRARPEARPGQDPQQHRVHELPQEPRGHPHPPARRPQASRRKSCLRRVRHGAHRGRDGGSAAHFLAPLVGLPSAAVGRHGRRRRVGRVAGFELAHRRAVEFEPVGVVDDAIQDRVAEGGLADNLMPGGHGELAGDQDGAAAVAILDDLHEIAPLAGREAIGSPVVEDEEIDLDQHAEQPREPAVAVGEIEIGEQARHAGVVDGVAVAAGLLRQRAGQPRLADAARAGDQQAAVLGDPAAGGQLLEQRLVEPARRAVVDVLDRGLAVTQPSGAQSGLEAPGAAIGGLAVEQQRQPFGVREIAGLLLRFELDEGLRPCRRA